jgi:hypothetical protein
LEGQFRRYGPLVTALVTEENPRDRVDPMARLFPKVTKCTIHTFGPAGSVQTHDALCVLPLNVVNEKIFVILWFWLAFLAGAGGLAVIYRYADPLDTVQSCMACQIITISGRPEGSRTETIP